MASVIRGSGQSSFSGSVSVGGTLTYEDVTSVDSIGIITARDDIHVGGGLSVTGISTFNGITTSTSTLFANDFSASGISTFGGSVIVGGGTTQLVVEGDARVTGILTIGTSSITLNPSTGKITGVSDSEIAAISSSIIGTGTTVDIFVYDTSKDSDGGAWRKRTQHTSWYNEELNTATRGSRKEFPSVAVIVAEADQVTIYDGDDPDLPMWMVFNTTSGSMLRSAAITSTSMLNGELCVCHDSGSGFHRIWFLKDTARWLTASSSYGGYYGFVPNSGGTTIAERNTAGENYFNNVGGASDITIASSNCNDVAMTVLPNAPIDPDTGLPVPTIAVGTDGGTSVIRDDGTVADLTGFNPIDTIHIDKDNVFVGVDTGSIDWVYKTHIPSTDESYAAGITAGTKNYYMNSNAGATIPVLRRMSANRTAYNSKDDIAYRGGNAGIDIIVADQAISNVSSKSAIAYASTSYNTGYMVGDIKGAFLSDTSTDDVTGVELITNGDFSQTLDTNVWIQYPTASNEATYSIVSGELQVIENNVNDYGIVSQHLIGLTVGKRYVIEVSARATTGTARWFVGSSQGNAGIVDVVDTTSSTLVRTSAYWTAVSTDAYVNLAAVSAAGATAYFDNITVKEAELDRSVNNKGLQVFGTVTKTAVATGADLVAYSGWSSSNYLRQPYNSDMNFGTDDFCVMGWINTSSLPGTTSVIVAQHNGINDLGNRWSFYILSSGLLGFYQQNGSNTTNTVDGPAITTGTWQHVVVARRAAADRVVFYLNGERLARTATSRDVTDTGNIITVGVDHSFGSAATNTSISLLRITKTIPSAEQIKKMYEDEKVLFQESSKCTLYGSSDAVTALAYDDDEETLYVGTSAGRSDFRGLRRINNTTVGITTAISASNGLVAEE